MTSELIQDIILIATISITCVVLCPFFVWVLVTPSTHKY